MLLGSLCPKYVPRRAYQCRLSQTAPAFKGRKFPEPNQTCYPWKEKYSEISVTDYAPTGAFSREQIHLLNYSEKASTLGKFPHRVTTIMGNRFISLSYSKRHFLCWTHFNPIFVTSYLSLILCSPPKKNKILFRLQELLPMLPNHISTVGRGRGALLVHFMR